MSETQPKRTTQVFIGIGVLLIIGFIAIASGPEPTQPVGPEPLPVGRYQIVSQPSDVVLRIDTYDGETHRLVFDPSTEGYQWERVN